MTDSITPEHPFAGNEEKKTHDIDLGDSHWLDWSTYQGETCGGIITHVKSQEVKAKQLAEYPDHPEWAEALCQAAFTIAGTKWHQTRVADSNGKHVPSWTLSGRYEQPTLSPSFLCHCGDHGFIREGKWVRA